MTFDFRDKTPAEMRTAAAIAGRDPEVRHQAAFSVDAMDMVNAFVPDQNRRPTDDWIRQLVTELEALPVPAAYKPRDPMLITECDQQMYHLAAQMPTPPKHAHCGRCQQWEAQFTRLEFGVNPKKRVYPVRFSGGYRVIEVLLCQECIDTLGVEPS